MTADRLVAWRERALDLVSGVRPGRVLNEAPTPAAPRTRDSASIASGPSITPGAPEMARNLKRAVNGLLADAGGSAGDRLDYRSLAAGQAYRDFRNGPALALKALDPATLSSREARLAFWINVYNALVIDAVIAFGVRRSVVEGPLGPVAFFQRAAYDIGGHRLNCNDIEHGVLRSNRGHPFLPGPQFGAGDPRRALVVHPPDVRIHFALNCASRSCPPIAAYEVEQIDRQLDLAARSFIAADVEIDPARHTVRVSRIFRWFAGDFGGPGGVIETLRRHLPDDARRTWLEKQQVTPRLTHRPYDWGLNAHAG